MAIETYTWERGSAYHRHDCDTCRYRGTFFAVGATTAVLDVWVHTEADGERELIVRSSSEGPEYSSFPETLARAMATVDNTWAKAVELLDNHTSRPRGHVQVSLEYGVTIVRQQTFYDDDGTGCKIVRFVTVESEPKDYLVDTVDELLKLIFKATQCHHEYDCCGQWYYSSPKFTHLPNGLVMVTQRGHMNV